MEEDQLFDACRAGELNGFAPRTVAPSAAMLIFFWSVLRVVNQNVGGVAVLVITGVDDSRIGRFNAVTGCPIRMM
jgi:hypothetical protein